MKTAKTIYFISICIVFLYSLNLLAESVEYYDGIAHHKFSVEKVDEVHFRFIYCRNNICKNVHRNLEKIPYSELWPAMAQLGKEIDFVRNNFPKSFLQQVDEVTHNGVERRWLDTTTIGEIPVRFGNSELKLSSWPLPFRAKDVRVLSDLTKSAVTATKSVNIETVKRQANSKRHQELPAETFLWNSVYFYWHAVHAMDSQAVNNPECMGHIELLQTEINKYHNEINRIKKIAKVQEFPLVNVTERSCSIMRWKKMIEVALINRNSMDINSNSMDKSRSAAIDLPQELIDLTRKIVMDGAK